MARDNNPLYRMGLTRHVLALASRSPQVLQDLIDRMETLVVKTLHPDPSREMVTSGEFADIHLAFQDWAKLTAEDQVIFLEEFLTPPDSAQADSLRFLQGRDDVGSNDAVVEVQAELTKVQGQLLRTSQRLQIRDQELGAAKAAMVLFNPNRNLEVSGLVQLIRSTALRSRESGGNVNRLNGYTFFGQTSFIREKVFIPIVEPTSAETTLAKVGESSPVAAKPKRAVKAPIQKYEELVKIGRIITCLYFVRSDTAVMRYVISRVPTNRSRLWDNEAEAVNTLYGLISELRSRGLSGDFTSLPDKLGGEDWQYCGHLLGQLDPIMKTFDDAARPEGTKLTVGTIVNRLERDLSRVIRRPNLKIELASPMTLLTLEPVVMDGQRIEAGEDINIRYVYRQITVQNALDPICLGPL